MDRRGSGRGLPPFGGLAGVPASTRRLAGDYPGYRQHES